MEPARLSGNIFKIFACCLIATALFRAENPGREWTKSLPAFPYKPASADRVVVQVVRQDFVDMQINKSVFNTPLEIGGQNLAETREINHHESATFGAEIIIYRKL